MKSNFEEKNVIVKGTYDLAATIAIPENRNGQMPAVVIVPGTGTSDRDGNMKNFRMNIYKDLSDFYAGLGFVTIRYDKRGVGESIGEHILTGFHDLVDDIIANIKYLESLDYVDKDKILLCGHSEGTMLTTIASTRHKIAGLILISGAGCSLRTALNYQNWLVLQETKTTPGLKGWILRRAINDHNYLKNVNKLFDKCNGTNQEIIRIQGQKMPAKWFREHDSFTNEKLMDVIINADFPILAITGGMDVQANPKDIEKIASLQLPHVTSIVVPDVDHLLRTYKGEKTVLNVKKQYKNELSQPLNEEFLANIREWVLTTVMEPIEA